jgi:hypothetical protein
MMNEARIKDIPGQTIIGYGERYFSTLEVREAEEKCHDRY